MWEELNLVESIFFSSSSSGLFTDFNGFATWENDLQKPQRFGETEGRGGLCNN